MGKGGSRHGITRRELAGWLTKMAAVASLSRLVTAQTHQAERPAQLEDLVVANHILAQQEVLDGYGHVSVRDDASPSRYLLSRSLAPAQVTAADILHYDLDSRAVDAAGRASFVERFIHGEIYRARADVQAVVHSHAPALIPFGITTAALKPVYHMSAFVGEGVPVFEIRKFRGTGDRMLMLVHNQALGRALAETLGRHPAALMRGHGAVIVGSSLPEVVGRSVYLVMNAKLQAQAMRIGGPINYLDSAEARDPLPDNYRRAWELWKKQAEGCSR